jgi:cytochrome c
MKLILIFEMLLFFSTAMFACNTQNQKNNQSTSTDSLINTSGRNEDSAFQKGAHLIATNDCLTCHKVDSSGFGPSYNEISAKYSFEEGNIENLAHSITHGSKGAYGPREMPAHSTINYDDAYAMAQYILSLEHVPSIHPNQNAK